MKFALFTGMTGTTWDDVLALWLAKLQAAGVGMLFIPTFLLPTDRRPTLDRFLSEIAPAFR
ncbi:MAG: hypothetical protein ACREJY_06910 [Candidatus Rokuibacteriota bacterium]